MHERSKAEVGAGLIARIVEFPHLDSAFVEIIEQACIDAHFAEVFPKSFPVGAATADRAVVDSDHSIAPDIGCRLARNAHLVRREIGYSPCEPTTQRAVAVRDPFGLARKLYLNVAAVAASVNAHGAL